MAMNLILSQLGTWKEILSLEDITNDLQDVEIQGFQYRWHDSHLGNPTITF